MLYKWLVDIVLKQDLWNPEIGVNVNVNLGEKLWRDPRIGQYGPMSMNAAVRQFNGG